MELKGRRLASIHRESLSFNRTFMELKVSFKYCVKSSSVFQSHLYGIESEHVDDGRCRSVVSIAPLWNWKFVWGLNGCRAGQGFNRTFMELKAWNVVVDDAVEQFQSHLYGIERKDRILLKWCSGSVSIAPLWNWKVSGDATLSHDVEFQSHLYGIESKDIYFRAIRACVSIAPLWNWKGTPLKVEPASSVFQSHLYGIESEVYTIDNKQTIDVSIAPLWNWKFEIFCFWRRVLRFQSHLYGIESFNSFDCLKNNRVSIAPLWNWKL